MKLPLNTYVRVHEGNREWYGVITGYLSDGSYQIRVGGMDRQVTVPPHQASLHPMFVASGHVPTKCLALAVAVSNQDVRYHITSVSNLNAIHDQGGLVPKKQARGTFAGLDAARGAITFENIPDRIGKILKDQSSNPSFAEIFDKMHADALLGSKEEFVYATRFPRTICFYAYEIKTRSNIDLNKLVVFKFSGRGHTWYKDLEDDAAEKTLTMIASKEMQVACFKPGKEVPDESPSSIEAKDYLDKLTWTDCSQNGWLNDVKMSVRLAALSSF
jgi:hypothetical protein